MIDAEQQVEADGYELLAIFHSHPTSPPKPSVRDRDDAFYYDPYGYLVHLIVSLQDDLPEIRGWSYAGEQPVEMTLITQAGK